MEKAGPEEEQWEEELGEERQGRSAEELAVAALLALAEPWLEGEEGEALGGEELKSAMLSRKKSTRRMEEVVEEVGEWGSQTRVSCLQPVTGGDSLSNLWPS